MRCVVVHHPDGGTTKFDGETVHYGVQSDGTLVVFDWEMGTQTGTATFANGRWAYVTDFGDKVSSQATRLVVTVGEPIPKPVPSH